MASIYVDLDKERDGVWFTHRSGCSFKIRPLSCINAQERVQKEIARAVSDHGPGCEKKGLSEEEYAKIMKLVIAEECIVDWKDVDQAPTYSVEKAREIMNDPRCRLFQDWATNCAASFSDFAEAHIKAIEKN